MKINLGGEEDFEMPDEMYEKIQLIAVMQGKSTEEMAQQILREMLGVFLEDNPYT